MSKIMSVKVSTTGVGYGTPLKLEGVKRLFGIYGAGTVSSNTIEISIQPRSDDYKTRSDDRGVIGAINSAQKFFVCGDPRGIYIKPESVLYLTLYDSAGATSQKLGVEYE